MEGWEGDSPVEELIVRGLNEIKLIRVHSNPRPTQLLLFCQPRCKSNIIIEIETFVGFVFCKHYLITLWPYYSLSCLFQWVFGFTFFTVRRAAKPLILQSLHLPRGLTFACYLPLLTSHHFSTSTSLPLLISSTLSLPLPLTLSFFAFCTVSLNDYLAQYCQSLLSSVLSPSTPFSLPVAHSGRFVHSFKRTILTFPSPPSYRDQIIVRHDS